MATLINKKFLLAIILFATIIISQAFLPQGRPDNSKPENLKVLPRDISHDDLMKIMKDYCKSLGVRCNHCHVVSKEATATEHAEMDFASDNKPEKVTARAMMKMVEAINSKYLEKMNTSDYHLEQVACVTCHMGTTKPYASVDSLRRTPAAPVPPGQPGQAPQAPAH